MLTRRQIRVKAMQFIYAHYNGNQQSLKNTTKGYTESCLNMSRLHTTLLALFSALWHYAEEKDALQKSNRRSDLPLNPNFGEIISLAPLKLIAKHPFLQKQIEQHKITLWDMEFKFVGKLIDEIVEREVYKEYLSSENKTFKQQQKLLIALFKNTIAPNEQLYNYIEDLQMQWVDDLPVVNTYLLKQLRKLKEQDMSSLSFPDFSQKQEDIDFGKELIEKVIANEEELQKELDGKTPNWDPERIAFLDSLLIKIAIAELIYFEEIPLKVTLNEYLELAKEYSTPKSNFFINGVLDNLVKEYKENNRIHKSGRGLLE